MNSDMKWIEKHDPVQERAAMHWEHGKDEDVEWFCQEIPESGAFAVACGEFDGYMLASIQWNTASAGDAVKAAILAVREGREAGLSVLREEHERWWSDYYQASAITIPDTRLEGYYYLETYTLACCTRPEGPHMTLCGPWSDDTGYGPICDNDYHWNNEQEMQVWPVYTGNRLGFAEPMYRMIEDNLETLKDVCRFHFKCDGAFLAHSTDSRLRPTYASVDNYELNGLPWVCFHFWKHYRYTMDRDFLEKRAYPLMKLAVIPLLSELKEGSDGCLHYPWSSSPEYHGVNDTYRWMRKEAPDWTHRFGPDATIDLALTKWLLKTLCEASVLLGEDPDQRIVWADTLSRLAPYAKDQWGGYKDCPPAWAECAFTGLRCEGAFLLDAARNNYNTTFVKVYAEKGGRIRIDTDFGTGELTGPDEFADGIYILDMKPGETAVICRGDGKEAAFVPLDGNCTEDHYFGVKRVRRF